MPQEDSFDIVTFGEEGEKERRNDFLNLMRNCPIPDDEILLNTGLFLTPQTLSRVLFMDFLYRQILEVQGIVVDFGCRWGQNTSLFTALRGIYEPFNRLRKIVAFDTFEGFPDVDPKDGELMNPGGYGTTKDYEAYLAQVLDFQEKESPLPHIKKYEIVKGDASRTIHEYLDQNPETIISLAYFDMDIYEPTLECLGAIKGRITRGTVIGFDEINDHSTPGETLALQDVLGLDRFAIRRYRYNARTSFLVVE
jgi:hypothetical protein|tara:strand:- start:625 stop:1380 length:756 start_codon:yes stop_codon:yes gene_type:complete